MKRKTKYRLAIEPQPVIPPAAEMPSNIIRCQSSPVNIWEKEGEGDAGLNVDLEDSQGARHHPVKVTSRAARELAAEELNSEKCRYEDGER